MNWKVAKRPMGYAAAGGMLILLTMMAVIPAKHETGGAHNGGTPTLFLLSMGGAALLGAASIRLLRRPPRSIRRRTQVNVRKAPASEPLSPKMLYFFNFEIVYLLRPSFASLEEATKSLHIDIEAVTGGRADHYTIADLERFVVGHLVGTKHGVTQLGPAFHQVREALTSTLHISKRSIRPSARLEDLFPKEGRAAMWTAFFQRLNVPSPELELPDGYKWIAVLMMLPFLFLASVGLERGPGLVAIIGIGGFVLVLRGLFPCLRRFGLATTISPACPTVGDLVRQLARNELQVFQPWTEAQLNEHIHDLISSTTGIPRMQIRTDARLGALGLRLGSS
jgi:hypothetical protein